MGFADLEKGPLGAVPFGEVPHEVLEGRDAFIVLFRVKVGPAYIVKDIVLELAVGVFRQEGPALFYGALVVAAFVEAVDQPVAGQIAQLWNRGLGFCFEEIGSCLGKIGRCLLGFLALASGIALAGG